MARLKTIQLHSAHCRFFPSPVPSRSIIRADNQVATVEAAISSAYWGFQLM